MDANMIAVIAGVLVFSAVAGIGLSVIERFQKRGGIYFARFGRLSITLSMRKPAKPQVADVPVMPYWAF